MRSGVTSTSWTIAGLIIFGTPHKRVSKPSSDSIELQDSVTADERDRDLRREPEFCFYPTTAFNVDMDSFIAIRLHDEEAVRANSHQGRHGYTSRPMAKP